MKLGAYDYQTQPARIDELFGYEKCAFTGARGRFRQDLYYRLNGLTLLLPPLRPARRHGRAREYFLARFAPGAAARSIPRRCTKKLGAARSRTGRGEVGEDEAEVRRRPSVPARVCGSVLPFYYREGRK